MQPLWLTTSTISLRLCSPLIVDVSLSVKDVVDERRVAAYTTPIPSFGAKDSAFDRLCTGSEHSQRRLHNICYRLLRAVGLGHNPLESDVHLQRDYEGPAGCS